LKHHVLTVNKLHKIKEKTTLSSMKEEKRERERKKQRKKIKEFKDTHNKLLFLSLLFFCDRFII